MDGLTHHDVTFFLLAVGVLLATARVLGEIAERFGQPAVVGEIAAGVLLGPTLLGRIHPASSRALFPSTGPSAVALEGLSILAIVLFLLVAGLEIDLSTVWRQGRRALVIGVAGIVGPFGVGFAAAWLAPSWMGAEANADPLIFSLFVATALSISALPVIAKTLMDLHLFRTDVGMTIVAAAVFNDLIGWIVFAVILGMMGGGSDHGPTIGTTIWLTLGFAAAALTGGRWLTHRILPWIQAHTSWPGGVLGFVLVLGLGAAAFTEWLGVHAIFGAFMVGVAVGDSTHLRKRTRTTLEQFIGFIFAPLFFATLGLHVDFAAHFDPLLCIAIFVIATAGKLLGCLTGARLAGVQGSEGWAIAFGMNARGAMEIILGLLALRAGLIGEPLFVALVVMALGTSILSGPLMQRVLRRQRPGRFFDHLSPAGFVGRLEATNRRQAIEELCARVAPDTGLSVATLVQAVWNREQLMATGLTNRVAVPNARIPGLSRPVVALGLSSRGIDFDASDGQTARIICLLLVPEDDAAGQWAILSNISSLLDDAPLRERLLGVSGFTELRALFKLALDERSHDGDERPRQGCIFVGASPFTRAWARRLADMGTPVWIVDSNRSRVEAAQREGLNAVAGNAASEVTLMAAHAFDARTLVAATPNGDINAEAAAFARETFAVPELAIVASPGSSRAWDDGVHHLALNSTQLRALSELPRDGAERWQRVTVDVEGPLEVQSLPEDFLPLIIERAAPNHAAPAWPGMRLTTGDTVVGMITSRASAADVTHAQIRRTITRAPVLEVEGPTSAEVVLRDVSRSLAVRLSSGADELYRRFCDHARTEGALTPEIAIPHLRVDGEGVFEMVICRAREGVSFGVEEDRPRALFILVSSLDLRNLHLETLAMIARIAQRDDFMDRWLDARDGESLRAWLLGVLSHGSEP